MSASLRVASAEVPEPGPTARVKPAARSTRGSAARLVSCALALAAGCGGETGHASLEATLTSVAPRCASNTSATPLAIRGTLPVKPVVSLSGSNESTLDIGYRAWVGEVELTGVAWVDATTLTAIVPAGIAAGVYAVAIESPFGDRSVLEGFTVAAGPCSRGPAALVVVATAAPALVTPGSRVVVNATVRNTGETAANGVKTAVAAPAGFRLFTSATDALDLAPGQSRTFTWTFTADAGRGAFGVSASGVDAGSNASVSTPQVSTNEVVVAAQGSPETFVVGGSVAGLAGSGLVLRLNAGNDLAIPAGATSFTFLSALAGGAPYDVTVAAQPSSPTQTCTVSNGTGAVAGADVTNVAVSCTTRRFTVGGTIAGLTTTGLVLRLDGANDLAVPAGATTFAFTTALLSGAAYEVAIVSQPAGASCTVARGSGTIGGANVTDVNVSCFAGTYTVGGTVSGLAGTGLVLRLNGVTDLPVNGNGSFAFLGIVSGTPYSVTVRTQPSSPAQTCTVSNGTGTVLGADVVDIAVSCVTPSYTVGGTVSGLDGKLALQLQYGSGASSNLNLSADGPFTFGVAVPSGAAYEVTVRTQPKGQTCRVTNGSGTVGDGDVTGVVVACARSR